MWVTLRVSVEDVVQRIVDVVISCGVSIPVEPLESKRYSCCAFEDTKNPAEPQDPRCNQYEIDQV